MLPLDYSQALGRFKKIISLQQSGFTAKSLFSCHSSLCAVLQDGWNISWTHIVLGFCCCCCCLFVRKHHSCFFSVWHNRKSIWQVGFTASLKTLCPLYANPLDTNSKCCTKITHSHMAGVLRKKQPNRQESRPDPGEGAQSSKPAEGELARNQDKWQEGSEGHQQPELPWLRIILQLTQHAFQGPEEKSPSMGGPEPTGQGM